MNPMISNPEQEVNRIRLKIYEETKALSPEQYRERLDRITKTAAEKYGFKVAGSAKETVS